jgi:chromate transport protein ChrA
MANFLFDLASNLALLAVVVITCGMYNRFTPGPAINGAHVFAALALAALLLDAALTFLVFADAQNRYGQFSTPAAFFVRAAAYVIAIVTAFAWHHVTRRKRAAKSTADETLVIHTSPYSQSHLRL